MGNAVKQIKIVTTQTTIRPTQGSEEAALFNQDGTPFTPGGITTTQAVAAVAAKPQIVAVTAVTAANGAVAVGANPTKAEYDVVVAEVNSVKAQLNALIAALKA